MKSLALALAFSSCVLTTSLFADASPLDLKKIEASYTTRLAKLADDHEKQVQDYLVFITKKSFVTASTTSEALAIRDYQRFFSNHRDITENDIVAVSEGLAAIQKSYLANKKALAEEILGGAQESNNIAVLAATKDGNLDKAILYQKQFEELKDKLGYKGVSLLTGSASALPPEVTITEPIALKINLMGQTTVSLQLDVGETYKTRGITGDSVVIEVGSDHVTIPIKVTDLSERVAAAKKGIAYQPKDSEPEQQVENKPTFGDRQTSAKAAGRFPVRVAVPANMHWTRSGVTVARGQKYRISYVGGGWTANPQWGTQMSAEGKRNANASSGYPAPGYSEGSLIGKVGNGQIFHIGNDGTTPPNSVGEIMFSINDNPAGFGDNSGSVFVEITPAR